MSTAATASAPAWLAKTFSSVVCVVVGHVGEAFGQRLESDVLLGLARRRQRGEGAPVKRLLGADHDVATAAGPTAGQLQRTFVGLRARIAEEHLTACLPGAAVDEAIDGQGHLGADLVAIEV